MKPNKSIGRAAFGRWLACARKDAGLSQCDVARRIDGLGVQNYRYLSQVENGVTKLSTRHVVPIARVIGMAPEEMVLRFLRDEEPALYRALAPVLIDNAVTLDPAASKLKRRA